MRREIVLTKEGNAFIFVGANPVHAFNCIPADDDEDERGIIARKGHNEREYVMYLNVITSACVLLRGVYVCVWGFRTE